MTCENSLKKSMIFWGMQKISNFLRLKIFDLQTSKIFGHSLLITECKDLCPKKDKIIGEVIMLGRNISTGNF